MSFGFDESVREIDKALAHARGKHVLLFAAASNCGANGVISWPARHENVLCVHAATAEGNPYKRSPTVSPHMENFSFLGDTVKGWWLPDEQGSEQKLYKSGTSTATPIAAGVAAVVIMIMRRSRDSYLACSNLSERDYDDRLLRLKTRTGMSAIFRMMHNGNRFGYFPITPWKLLCRQDRDWTLIEKLLEALKIV